MCKAVCLLLSATVALMPQCPVKSRAGEVWTAFPRGIWEKKTQTRMMRKNCYHATQLALQCLSKWFEIRTAYDPPQLGMGRDLVDDYLNLGNPSQQSIRQTDVSLPVLEP